MDQTTTTIEPVDDESPVDYATAPVTLHHDGLADLVAVLRKHTDGIDCLHPPGATDSDRIYGLVCLFYTCVIGDGPTVGFVLAERTNPTVDLATRELIDELVSCAGAPGHPRRELNRHVYDLVDAALEDRRRPLLDRANELMDALTRHVADHFHLRAVHDDGTDPEQALLGPDIAERLHTAFVVARGHLPHQVTTALATLRHRRDVHTHSRLRPWDGTDPIVVALPPAQINNPGTDLGAAIREIDQHGQTYGVHIVPDLSTGRVA